MANEELMEEEVEIISLTDESTGTASATGGRSIWSCCPQKTTPLRS